MTTKREQKQYQNTQSLTKENTVNNTIKLIQAIVFFNNAM